MGIPSRACLAVLVTAGVIASQTIPASVSAAPAVEPASIAAASAVEASSVTAAPAAKARAGRAAPGAPGVDEQYLPADKSGFGTARSTASKVWFTVQKEGGLGEIYFPTVDSPAARTLDFMVADRSKAGQSDTGRGDAGRGDAGRPGKVVRAADAAEVVTSVIDERSLSFRQTFTERRHAWRLTLTYASDPARATVLVDVSFTGREYDLYAIYDPALANTRGNDSGRTEGSTLLATDGTAASAFRASPAFTSTSNGFRGVSDGWTDARDGRFDWRYASASAGNLVQTAKLGLARGHATLAVAFGTRATATATATTASATAETARATTETARAAAETARAAADVSLRRGFGRIARDYAYGWHRYVDRLRKPPAALRTTGERQLYRTSAMVLAAAEDKTHRGAYVAAPAMPWAFGSDDPSGPYHLVWSRDLYQVATGLIAAGDTAGAGRALDYLLTVQQRPDGSFPQNSRVDGTPFWGGLQLDEVALPIVLAHQLGRTDSQTWSHVQKAADFLLAFEQDGHRAPWSPQERWENQSGFSPGTIAAEIAGLVCAADIARANNDSAAAERYLATADDWQSRVKDWTVTTTGPYSDQPYFLRLTKDGNPDAGTTYAIGDSGPSGVDQRAVVDPSFLELVRLGVLPAGDPVVRNSLTVVDDQLSVRTKNGLFWHRASFDGFGEQADGSQWEYDQPDDSLLSRGRLWPLLTGERGEHDLALERTTAARGRLATMARAAGPGFMLPEQVWDDQAPAGRVPGTPTFSATPLTWAHAQYLRLARNVAAGRVLEQPDVVAARYRR